MEDALDGVAEAIRVGVLQQVASRARAQGPEQLVVACLGGEDDDCGLRHLGGDSHRGGDTAGAGHSRIHHADVRAQLPGRLDRVLARRNLAADPHSVGLERKAHPGARRDVVVGK